MADAAVDEHHVCDSALLASISADIAGLSTLLITIYKVMQYWAQHGRSHLLDIFLQDGIQYFVVVTSANIVNVVYMKSKVKVEGLVMQGGNLVSSIAVTSLFKQELMLLSERSNGSCNHLYDGL